jgi:SAM-dependent methyltransferase
MKGTTVSDSSRLAEIYDTIYQFKDYTHDVGYVLEAIRSRVPDARTLLDVACGTGNHVQGLSSAYAVEGLDLSAAMLERAKAKHPSTRFHQGNMAGFDLGRKFDVVCCLFRSIAYVSTPDNLRNAIASMARHMNEGGLLLVEPFFRPDTYWSGRVTMNQVDRPDLKIAWMYVSERRGDIGIMNTHYLVGRPAGVEHFTEVHEMGLFSRDDYASAFQSAGLELEYDEVGPSRVGFYLGRLRPNAAAQ